MMDGKIRTPKKVIVKTMTVNKGIGVVHQFFKNMEYLEIGGAIDLPP